VVLGLRSHVQEDDVAASKPILKLEGGHQLHLAASAEVLVGEDRDLGDMPDRHLAHRSPQIDDPVARQAVEDPRPLPP
jgi:hypothetical protein